MSDLPKWVSTVALGITIALLILALTIIAMFIPKPANAATKQLKVEDIGIVGVFGVVRKFQDGNTICYILANSYSDPGQSISCVRTK